MISIIRASIIHKLTNRLVLLPWLPQQTHLMIYLLVTRGKIDGQFHYHNNQMGNDFIVMSYSGPYLDVRVLLSGWVYQRNASRCGLIKYIYPSILSLTSRICIMPM